MASETSTDAVVKEEKGGTETKEKEKVFVSGAIIADLRRCHRHTSGTVTVWEIIPPPPIRLPTHPLVLLKRNNLSQYQRLPLDIARVDPTKVMRRANGCVTLASAAM